MVQRVGLGLRTRTAIGGGPFSSRLSAFPTFLPHHLTVLPVPPPTVSARHNIFFISLRYFESCREIYLTGWPDHDVLKPWHGVQAKVSRLAINEPISQRTVFRVSILVLSVERGHRLFVRISLLSLIVVTTGLLEPLGPPHSVPS